MKFVDGLMIHSGRGNTRADSSRSSTGVEMILMAASSLTSVTRLRTTALVGLASLPRQDRRCWSSRTSSPRPGWCTHLLLGPQNLNTWPTWSGWVFGGLAVLSGILQTSWAPWRREGWGPWRL